MKLSITPVLLFGSAIIQSCSNDAQIIVHKPYKICDTKPDTSSKMSTVLSKEQWGDWARYIAKSDQDMFVLDCA